MLNLLNIVGSKITETTKTASIGDKSVRSNTYSFKNLLKSDISSDTSTYYNPVSVPPSALFDPLFRNSLLSETSSISLISYADKLYNQTQDRNTQISKNKYFILA
jgi:hypothetical protein